MFIFDRFDLTYVNIWKSFLCPFLIIFGLKNHFLALKTDVSTPYKPKIEGKLKC
jgi:hypothetical protein